MLELTSKGKTIKIKKMSVKNKVKRKISKKTNLSKSRGKTIDHKKKHLKSQKLQEIAML